MGGKEAGKLPQTWSLGPRQGEPSLSDPTAHSLPLPWLRRRPVSLSGALSPAGQLAGPPVVLWHQHCVPCSRGQQKSPGPAVSCFSSEGTGHFCSRPIGQIETLPN